MTDTTDHPSRRAGLRDELVNALGQITTTPPVAHRRAQADHVLAVLYREWPWLRAEAEDAAPAVVPAADRAALRDRIADALYVHDHPGWRVPLREADVEPVYQERAAAILSVLPAPADRAAVLEEAADKLAEFIALHGPTSRTVAGWTGAEAFLRRMAVESAAVDRVAAETEAHPAEHTWAAELHDPLADEWVPGTRYTDRDRAVNALTHAKRLGPTWKDGTPTERRLVRATTTYTVEEPDGPAVEAQPGKDTETPEVVAYSDR
ncbi:hypothetical protein [Streptomyces caniscabiei]|uniref:hypothetical protein n=1 Tax=Streptomyces caniscabiei TaxID=2746961 RepID=UPI0029AD2B23|nr:hypothetical protein [Streptomyces caniscabiei]MDX3725254.1 hypothetical protein [Streptomyces caniscabiei]